MAAVLAVVAAVLAISVALEVGAVLAARATGVAAADAAALAAAAVLADAASAESPARAAARVALANRATLRRCDCADLPVAVEVVVEVAGSRLPGSPRSIVARSRATLVAPPGPGPGG